MGIEIDPDPPENGDSCAYFSDPGNTPVHIYVQFNGIVACPERAEPPNLHLFTLTQHETYHCVWQSGDNFCDVDIQLQYSPGPPHTTLNMWDSNGRTIFNSVETLYAPEHHVFPNNNPDCSNSFSGLGGIGTIMWFKKASEILSEFVIPTDKKILMEFFTTPSGQPVYKFCIPKYSMNIKFKLDV